MYLTNAAPFWAAFFISKITKIRKKIMNPTILSIVAFASATVHAATQNKNYNDIFNDSKGIVERQNVKRTNQHIGYKRV